MADHYETPLFRFIQEVLKGKRIMDKMTEIEILFVAEMSVEQGNDLMPLIEAQGWNIDTLHSQDKEFYYIELVKTGFIRTWYLSEALEKAFSLLDVNMISFLQKLMSLNVGYRALEVVVKKTNKYPGMYISDTWIKRIGDLGLSVDIDIY